MQMASQDLQSCALSNIHPKRNANGCAGYAILRTKPTYTPNAMQIICNFAL
jgi:hypothetical protein